MRPREPMSNGRPFFHLLLVCLLLGTWPGPSEGAIPTNERQALIAIYNSTGGDAWHDTDGWKTPPLAKDDFAASGTECPGAGVDGWYGIVCSGEPQRVIGLYLYDNNLSGGLPAEIGNLTALRDLDLAQNGITGLPSTIGNLGALEYLSLWDNALVSLPAEIGSLTALLDLDLAWNLITSLPAEIGNLNALESLDLWGNHLGSLPAEIGGLTALEYLDLEGNDLESLPSRIGDLAALETLYLTDNKLVTLPIEIMELANLSTLDVAGNLLVISNDALRDWVYGTAAPADITAVGVSNTSLTLTWTPTPYFYGSGEGGAYEVLFGTTSGGPYTLMDTTLSKNTAALQVTGLTPGTPYYFVIRTFTDPESGGRITGDPSPPVTATTTLFPLGDVDHSNTVDLADAILCLQVAADTLPSTPIHVDAEVNGDRRIGVADAVWITQKLSGLYDPLPESDHPYPNNFDYTWEHTLGGTPLAIAVTFDPRTHVEDPAGQTCFDEIHVLNSANAPIAGSPFCGASLAGQTVVVTGDTVKIRLISDDTLTEWGFKVTRIQALQLPQ